MLDNFFGKISGALGSASDFIGEIRETAGLITDITQGLAGQMTLFLEDSLVGFIDTGLAAVKSFFFGIYKANPLLALMQTKAFNGAALKPIQRLFNTFECLGGTIANSLFKTIEDMLVNAVKKGLVNPVACALEDFVGGLTNQITSTINSALDSVLGPINKLFNLIPNFGAFNISKQLSKFNNLKLIKIYLIPDSKEELKKRNLNTISLDFCFVSCLKELTFVLSIAISNPPINDKFRAIAIN